MKIRKILLVSLSLLTICSCNSSDNFDEKLLDNYVISKDDIEKETKIYRVSNVVNSSATSQVSVSIDWTVSLPALFFDKNCTMSRDELGAFLKSQTQADFTFDKEKYACVGTDFYSYSSKAKIDKMEANSQLDNLENQSAFFYICDLQKYTITSKNNKSTFNVYMSIGDIILSFENI